MSVTRRNFLFGTVASAAAGALIIRPSADVAKIFEPTLGEIVSVQRASEEIVQRSEQYPPTEFPFGEVGEAVYNSKGQVIGLVESCTVSMDTEVVDVTGRGDSTRRYWPGPRTIRMDLRLIAAGRFR